MSALKRVHREGQGPALDLARAHWLYVGRAERSAAVVVLLAPIRALALALAVLARALGAVRAQRFPATEVAALAAAQVAVAAVLAAPRPGPALSRTRGTALR